MGFMVASLSLSLAVAASAQNLTFLTSLAQELTSLGLTSLVTAVTSINSTAAGQSLLSQLGNSSQTIFAPNNAGCELRSRVFHVHKALMKLMNACSHWCSSQHFEQPRPPRECSFVPRRPRLFQRHPELPKHHRRPHASEPQLQPSVLGGRQESGSRLV